MPGRRSPFSSIQANPVAAFGVGPMTKGGLNAAEPGQVLTLGSRGLVAIIAEMGFEVAGDAGGA